MKITIIIDKHTERILFTTEREVLITSVLLEDPPNWEEVAEPHDH